MQSANDAAAVVPAITDALHALLVARADALGAALKAPMKRHITDAIEAYEAVRWPGGRADGGNA